MFTPEGVSPKKHLDDREVSPFETVGGEGWRVECRGKMMGTPRELSFLVAALFRQPLDAWGDSVVCSGWDEYRLSLTSCVCPLHKRWPWASTQ